MKGRRLHIDRVTAAVAATSLLLLCLTLLVFFLPSLHFVYRSPELSTAIESLCILIALGAFYLCYARFRVTSELRLLFLALAFLILGLYNLVHAVLVPVAESRLNLNPDLLTYFWLTARLASALLLIASLWAGSRQVSIRRGWLGVGGVIATVALLAALFFSLDSSGLPHLLSPGGWELVREGGSPEILGEVTTIGGIYQALIGACFLAAGAGYLHLYRREHRPFWGWLSVSFVAAFFTQVHFLMYPSIYTSYVYTGDFLRLFSRVVLFVGTYAEITYAYRHLQARNQQLKAMQEISILGMSTRDSKEILAGITAIVQNIFNVEKVVLLFLDREKEELVVREPVIGLSHEQADALRLQLSEKSLAVKSLKTGKAIASNDARNDPGINNRVRDLLDIRSIVIAPLRTATQNLGVILAINKRQGKFDGEEVRFLTIIAGRAAMVIENARLHEQLETAAVLEERTRLAREIHDGLAQNLGYLNLKLPQVLGYMADDTPKALDELGSMRRIVQESLTEARQAIVDLQTPITHGSFLEAVSEYAREFTDTTDIEVDVVSEHRHTRLKPFAKAEMVRIIQEALNNIRRHAEASTVKIVFTRNNGSLRVEISDDGKGFSPEEVFDSGKRRRNFGVRSMKGRALRLGGEFSIKSKPQRGTTVLVEVPLQEEAT